MLKTGKNIPRTVILRVTVFIIITFCGSLAGAQVRVITRTGPVGGWQGGSIRIEPNEQLIIQNNPALSIDLSNKLSNQNFQVPPQVRSNGTTYIEPKNTPVTVKPVENNKIVIEPVIVEPPPNPSEYPIRGLYICLSEGDYSEGTKSCDEIIKYYFFSVVEPLPEFDDMLKSLPIPPALQISSGNEDIGQEIMRLETDAHVLLRKSKFKEAKEIFSTIIEKLNTWVDNLPDDLSQQIYQYMTCIENWISYCDAEMLVATSDNEAALDKLKIISEAELNNCGDDLRVMALMEMGFVNKQMGNPESAKIIFDHALSLCDNNDLAAFIHLKIALMLNAQYSREKMYEPAHNQFVHALDTAETPYVKITIHMSYASALQRFNVAAALSELKKAELICQENSSEWCEDVMKQINDDRLKYNPSQDSNQIHPPNPPDEDYKEYLFPVFGILAVIMLLLILRSIHQKNKSATPRLVSRIEDARYAFMSRFRNYLEIKISEVTKFEIQMERLIDDIAKSNDFYNRFSEEKFNPYEQKVDVSIADPKQRSTVSISVYYKDQQLSHDVVDLEKYRLT